MTLSLEVSRQAQGLIASRLGLSFPESRTADLERALVPALRGSLHVTADAYLAWLATLPEDDPEWARLARRLTVGETYFFRDRACFEALEREILPGLIAARRSEEVLRLRVWSAGCATGEEPYSLAILLDRLLVDRSDWHLTILATDINPEALAAAERGLYRRWSLRDTPEWIRSRYFHEHGADSFVVAPAIRRMVTFAPLNLAGDGYPSVVTNTSAMDLVFCRNVLMYFTREAQHSAAARLERALLPGGWLAVSAAEGSADLLSPLVPVNFPGAVFFHKRQDPTPAPQLAPPLRIARPVAAAPPARAEAPRREEAPASPESLVERARALADRGSLEEARRLCEAALARDRLHADGHLLLAAICQEQGEIQAALAALRRAIYLSPESALAHFVLGSLLLRTGEHRRARRSMEIVVEMLSPLPPDQLVPASGGLTVRRMLEGARIHLDAERERAEPERQRRGRR